MEFKDQNKTMHWHIYSNAQYCTEVVLNNNIFYINYFMYSYLLQKTCILPTHAFPILLVGLIGYSYK